MTKANPSKVSRILNILKKDPRCPKCTCYLNEAEMWQKRCVVCGTRFKYYNDGSIRDITAIKVLFT